MSFTTSHKKKNDLRKYKVNTSISVFTFAYFSCYKT